MDMLLPRTLLALCLLLSACKQEKTPTTPAESAEKYKYLKAEGDFQRDNKNSTKAFAAYQQALPLCDKEADPVAWADTAKNLADCYLINRETSKAEPLYREILAQTDEKFGKDSLESADVINSLLTVFFMKGYGDDEEALRQRLVTIGEVTLAKNTPEELRIGIDSLALSNSLWHLGAFFEKSGRLEEAEPIFRRAVKAAVDSSKTIQYSQWTFDLLVKAYRKLLLKMGDTEEQAQEKIDKIMEPLSKK